MGDRIRETIRPALAVLSALSLTACFGYYDPYAYNSPHSGYHRPYGDYGYYGASPRYYYGDGNRAGYYTYRRYDDPNYPYGYYYERGY